MDVIVYAFCLLYILVDVLTYLSFLFGYGEAHVWSEADRLLYVNEKECNTSTASLSILFAQCMSHGTLEIILMLLVRFMQIRYIFKMWQKVKLYYVF